MAEMTERRYLDADALRDAREEPRVRIGGTLYVGRLLSIEQWLPFWDRLQQLSAPDANTTTLQWMAYYREYLGAVFPRPSWWRVWKSSPVPAIMALPFGDLCEVFHHFFSLQEAATFRVRTPTSRPSTPGTGLPGKTPAALDGAPQPNASSAASGGA